MAAQEACVCACACCSHLGQSVFGKPASRQVPRAPAPDAAAPCFADGGRCIGPDRRDPVFRLH
eukprot:4327208-Pyramimonas_sp.AAC.1